MEFFSVDDVISVERCLLPVSRRISAGKTNTTSSADNKVELRSSHRPTTSRIEIVLTVTLDFNEDNLVLLESKGLSKLKKAVVSGKHFLLSN